ncbi:MAG: DUF3575 domain-containing protein [Flavobacteriales bacterium]
MLKKMAIVLALSPLLGSAQKTEEENMPRRNAIKLDVHSPFVRTMNVSFEHATGPRTSFVLSALYADRSVPFYETGYLNRLAITPEFRYYIGRKDIPKGLYASGYLRYQWMNAYVYETNYDYINMIWTSVWSDDVLNTGGIGMGVGYQWEIKDRIRLDVQFGTIWNSGDKRVRTDDGGISEPNSIFRPYVGYFVKSNMCMGVSF